MSSKLPFFPWYASETEADGDWILMNLAERGLFITLLDYSWINDGLPTDLESLARIARVELDTFVFLWQRVGKKFFQSGVRLINSRQEIEKTKARAKSESARASVSARWAKPDQANTNVSDSYKRRNTRASKSKSISSSQSSSSLFGNEETPDKRSKLDAEFEDQFWSIVWLKLGKEGARKAYCNVRRKHSAEKIIAAVEKQGPHLLESARRQQRTAIYPATWLNECRFEDEDFALMPPDAQRNGSRKSASSEALDMVSQFIEREEREQKQTE